MSLIARSLFRSAQSAYDPYWSSVSLLVNSENNLALRDESSNNFSITRNGTVNPSLRTPFSGGVGGSLWFSGSSTSLVTPSSSAFALNGAFTYEAWVYPTVQLTGNGSSGTMLFGVGASGGFEVGHQATAGAGWGLAAYGVAWDLTTSTYPTLNAWNHIVVVRDSSNNTAIFLNGSRVASGTVSRSYAEAAAYVGSQFAFSIPFTGFQSNVRLVKGDALYDPSQSSLSQPSAPFSPTANTSLLVTGTGQGLFDNSVFVDQGPNAIAITTSGTPLYSGLSPFKGKFGSVYCASGASLNLASAAANALGSGDYTVECWVRYNTVTSNQIAVDFRTGVYTDSKLNLYLTGSTSKLTLYQAANSKITSDNALSSGVWYHVAITRKSSTTTLWINGSAQSTTWTDSTNYSSNTTCVLGRDQFGSSHLNGNITNFRVAKGAAIYDAAFTPPDSPLSVTSDTTSLVRCETGAFYDRSANGNPCSASNATSITTQQQKFGLSSTTYTATAYQTVSDAANLQFGSGDYTIEGWVRRNASGTLHSLLSKGGSTTGWLLQVNASDKLVFTVGSSALLTSTATIGATTWSHFAVARSGSTTRLFIGGNLEASATDSTNFNQTSALKIGADRGNANGLNGHLDDVRLTKGVARYTASFSTPTAPLTIGS